MEQTNWIKTTSDKNPKDGQSIYLISRGIAIHATVKAFQIIRLDDGALKSIRHFEYWADESISPFG